MPVSVRTVDELLLVAGDVSVVDRATLSLWHCQQLLRPHLTLTTLAVPDDKENGATANAAATNADAAAETVVVATRVSSVELEDGMAVAAVAFGDADEDDHHVVSKRDRRASITESEVSVDFAESDDATEPPTSIGHARLTMATRVSVVYRRYRCVLCLDASPSALAIDLHSGKVFLDMLYESVHLFVMSLLRPAEIGGVPFTPEFHVSVIVQGELVESLSVLVQGFVLDLTNAHRLLQLVRERLTLLEDQWAADAADASAQTEDLGGGDDTATKHRASLSSMLQNAVFAVNSLPGGAAPIIVLATDGVVDLFDAYTYDSLVMQLVRHDIQCHFLRIGGNMTSDPHASFGFVPDVDLLEFVAQASSGSAIDYVALHEACSAPSVRDSVKCMSSFQSSLLVRPSKIQAVGTPMLKLDAAWCASFDGAQYLPLRPYRMWREKVHEYRIHTDVDRIVEARIREGFTVNKVHVRNLQRLPDGSLGKLPAVSASTRPLSDGPISHAATKVLLVFVLQWKQNVWLEYVITSTIDHHTQGRNSGGVRSSNSKTTTGGGSGPNSVGQVKKDQQSNEWYVKVNVLADAEFLRSFEDSRAAPTATVNVAASPSLHEFIRNVQDVDRVLLHLMTAAASVISATDVASQFSFGTQASSSVAVPPHATNKTQSSHPVFGIIGELSPVLWHRWFHVDRFEVLSVVVDEPSPEVFYPRPMSAPIMSRSANVPVGGRSRQSRRAGMSLEVNVHPLIAGRDQSVDRIRAAVLRWSSQRLGKDLYLRFLTPDPHRQDDRAKHSAVSASGVVPLGRRRQQRSSLNSATLTAQIIAGMEQNQLHQRREEQTKGALCFVRVEAKNHTLVVIHVAFFSASASTRRETLAELKNIVVGNEAQGSASTPQATSFSTAQASRKLVLCHRMISRLLVTHDTLLLEDIDAMQDRQPTPEKHLVACCGGSELQLRSVFGAFMWHSSWKWHLVRNSNASVLDVMRHLHEARIRAGFWVLDWKLEEDGEVLRVVSVIFGREILMEDENGHLKTSLIQYGIRRTPDNCLVTSFWMEPQYGFAKTTLARDPAVIDHHDTFHAGLRHAVGHDVPLTDLRARQAKRESAGAISSDSTVSPLRGSSTYLDEGRLLELIREFIFDSDRHLLSCLHTFETLTSVREGRVDANTMGYTDQTPVSVIGASSEGDEEYASTDLVPAFSTARLLEASKRSSEHFLMYLERRAFGPNEAGATHVESVPALSSANVYLYSMLERTLRGLSDCEVAWTDLDGQFVTDALQKSLSGARIPATKSQIPLWFLQSNGQNGVSQGHAHQLSQGRCFAKLLPNDTVVLAFLPTVTRLEVKKRPLLSPSDTTDKKTPPFSGMSRWHERHSLKSAVSLESGDANAASASSLKMSVSADDIVLYQERRQSFREGYKSWRMGHFQGAKDEKSHRAGQGGQLSPHPKVASFSEDYEFCDSICQEADLGSDFHVLIEKADGALGSGYFQVAFYECSLAQLSTALTSRLGHRSASGTYEDLLGQLFATRVATQSTGDLAVGLSRAPVHNKRGVSATFGNRSGAQMPPPSPLTVTIEPSPTARPDPTMNMAVLHSSMTFRKKVKRAHEHNFSRGVYVALRDQSQVQQSDLIQALSSCVEVPIDLDITLLYRMLQVDMIRETVPRSALRSSMIDLVSGKPIRDALKERLEKSLEKILGTVFQGIDGTKYYFFIGSESMAIDDVVGVPDNEADAVQLLMEEGATGDNENEMPPHNPPQLVKSITIATDTHELGDKDSRGDLDGVAYQPFGASGVDDGLLSTVPVANGFERIDEQAVVSVSQEEAFSDQQQQQINQEEDAELNKDVAAATSSFSAPFFFRFEYRELAQQPEGRPRSTSSGVSNLKALSPPPRLMLHRSASSKSFLDPVVGSTNKTDVVIASNALPPSHRKPPMDSTNIIPAGKGSTGGGISEIAEWAAKVSAPKIALRLVTLTLPNEQLLEKTRGHQIGVDMQDQRQKITPAELFSSLPFFQRQVLKRTRKSIKEWSSVEILRILRSVESITEEIGRLVRKLFKDLPAECKTTVKYPLSFVNVHQENMDPVKLIERELLIGTDSLSVVKSGEMYFVVNKRPDEAYDVSYWAFLTVGSDHIQLQLHHQATDDDVARRGAASESFDRLAVLTSLHLSVNAISKRVNQFLLLLHLHETRSCSELLLRPDPGTVGASPPSPTSSGVSASARFNSANTSPAAAPFFWPGQFECDRKYAAFFRLNERMVPSIALTTLCTQALEQFQVHNRRHVFVYRDRGGHVFYFKMSASSSGAVQDEDHPALVRTLSSSALSNGSPLGILLEVFGVCNAGEEITQELSRLLERKLDETMQLILMKLLARNAKFQLSPSDLAFMCPPGASAASSVVYQMPTGLVPSSDASTVLLFLCQTLGMTSYIRQINTSPPSAPTRYERQTSTNRTTKAFIPADVTTEIIEAAQVPNSTAAVTQYDSSVQHPATFGQEGKVYTKAGDVALLDVEAISPVFFASSTAATAHEDADQKARTRVPVMLGHAVFAVNLNSELRLSPGFLARVGKGLAILRVEFLECDTECVDMVVDNEGEVVALDVGGVLGANSSRPSPDPAPSLLVRCQLWVRGPIQVPAFKQVYEAHLKESLSDYAIEATIREVRSTRQVVMADEESKDPSTLPMGLPKLVDLLETSAKNSASSVTKLTLPVAMPSWDLENVSHQVFNYLRASFPVHARPAIFVRKASRFVRIDADDAARLPMAEHFKMIPVPPVYDSSNSSGIASHPVLVHSDSIQSDMSEIDSMASHRFSAGSSTIESLSSMSHYTASSAHSQVKEYSTSELMFHSMAKGAAAESVKTAALPIVQQRSFYYVIDVSVNGGLVFYGYNLSHQVLDAVALHIARVTTWCQMRDRLLQCLLMQQSGFVYSALNGAAVVQPRVLLSGGNGSQRTGFAIGYVEFRTSIVSILQEFGVLPKTVESVNRLDATSFGKLLKEFGIQVIDSSGRSRNASSMRSIVDETSSGRAGVPLRPGILPSSSSQRSLGASVEKPAIAAKTTGGTTVPSPTKRASIGGPTSSLSIGPGHQSGGIGGGNGATNAARMRANPTAANALMAARARARGGGFPGKMGGGPGVGANRPSGAGEVAPWDLPVTNTKNNASSATAPSLQRDISGRASAAAVPTLGRTGSITGVGGVGPVSAPPKRPSGTSTPLLPVPAPSRVVSSSREARRNPWKSIVAQTWGPRHKFCHKNAFVEAAVRSEKHRTKTVEEPARGKMDEPLKHYGNAFQRRQDLLVSCASASGNCFTLFRRIKQLGDRDGTIDASEDKTVRSMMETGHVIIQQRFRVSYIERWEVVKIDEEYVEDGSNTSRLRALQASMDLVNLLSYKEEFVFLGNERVIAKLLTEHTVQAMCGKEGQAVREMKLQILKAVFHSRMDVVQRFFDQYATHLRALGFCHLRLPSSRLGRTPSTANAAATAGVGSASSASGSGSATPTRSSVDAFASEGEAFSEFFVHNGGIVRKAKGERRGMEAANAVLLLELKCDHSGVQVCVVLLNEEDLRLQQLGHQRHLDSTKAEPVGGALVKQVSQSLRDTLDTRILIHDFTVRFFYQCLLEWTSARRDGATSRPPQATSSSLHNMVKGVRCFLRSYPRSPHLRSNSLASRECALEAATVELPVRNLQSDFSESILVKILLRYIACHGSRYEVTDLTQFGTPDTIACQSAAGNFFNRQVSHGSSHSHRSAAATQTGYSLLVTTQELWKGKKRPKNSVLLALVRCAPATSARVVLLPIERAMHEAELFVKELFRAAAANYERDLLWSRLLHNDSQGPSADVAHTLALPVEYFRVEVGPQQLEECLRLSVCIPLQTIDPDLDELLAIEDVCWQEFALRLRDVYAGQVREYQFEGQAACHFLLLCPDARDLMIHLTFPSGVMNAALEGEANRVHVDICRREEPANHKFSLPQRRAITDFVNSVVHWLWRCLLYD